MLTVVNTKIHGSMAKGVNIYELMHAFWQENEYEPFSTAEIALFFFLLERANCRRWKMPFKCSTALVCRSIKVAKQTFLTARLKLSERGLITFIQGNGNAMAPAYTVISEPNKWTNGKTEEQPENETGKQTDGLTDNETDGMTDSLPTYNIKDNNIQNKDIISLNNKGRTDEILSLDELEEIFLADAGWHDEILREFPAVSRLELENQIHGFFSRLRDKGEKGREEKDCRNYFINSVRKFFKHNQNERIEREFSQGSSAFRRRGVDVVARTAKDYEEPFPSPPWEKDY